MSEITYDAKTDFGAIEIARKDNPDVILRRLEIQFQNGTVEENGGQRGPERGCAPAGIDEDRGAQWDLSLP